MRRNRRKRAARILAAAGMAISAAAIQAEAADASIPSSTVRADVMEMDLEDLMRMQVTSVSRKSERLSDAAAAIHVITQEDIRRSGATSIADILRLSPGLEVARQDAHTWAISSRGFNDEFANQLLVLIDGRSVYTPLFAGVYWDVQDLVLEDIERIEVIRGPGGTLWGANAVNGVINITTKAARDTQGVLVSGGVGTEERGFGTIRYGDKAGENGFYRVYARAFGRDDSELRDGSPANDSWWMTRGGFRYDWIPNDRNQYTLQGDLYTGELNQAVTVVDATQPGFLNVIRDRVEASGANILGRWTHTFSLDSELALKLYYDRTERDRAVFGEKRDAFDIDLLHRYRFGRNDLVWGLGYNVTADELESGNAVAFHDPRRTVALYSAFVQNEITLIEDRLRLTLGSKFEHNDFTGWEVQPSARLSLNITDRQTAWFAASRAVSTPSRAEEDLRLNRFVRPPNEMVPAPHIVRLSGSREMESKEVVSLELGYRIQPHERLTLDLATFYNDYDKQRSIELVETDQTTFPVLLNYEIGNLSKGESYGFELAGTWQAADWWRLRAHYNFWRFAFRMDAVSIDGSREQPEADSPRHQVGVRSLMDLPHHLEFDAGLRYVDVLSERRRFVASEDLAVPSYVVADARLGWRPNPNWEISLAAQNLFEARHQEFAPSYIQTEETFVETSVYAKVTFRF